MIYNSDEVEFGGSSPLTAAFFLSLACVKYGGGMWSSSNLPWMSGFSINPCLSLLHVIQWLMERLNWSILILNWNLLIIAHIKRTLRGNVKYSILDRIYRIGAFCVHPRIIFISDGRPTSFTNLASAFVEDSPLDETENVNNILLYKFSINNHVGYI